MKSFTEFFESLDLLGKHTTWRDWVIVGLLLGVLVLIIRMGISVLLRKKYCRDKIHARGKDIFWIGLGIQALMWFTVLTFIYKDVQSRIDVAEAYEKSGQYDHAYAAYYDLYMDIGEYRDICDRMSICLEKITENGYTDTVRTKQIKRSRSIKYNNEQNTFSNETYIIKQDNTL